VNKKEISMSDATTAVSLEQRIAAITSQNIKADANHLVESIRRQFSNPDEYSRELVANGLDAKATRIQIKGDVWEDDSIQYARLRFIDNGKGMSYADVMSYLTIFESHKDGKNLSVGKHGVGKLSPWADRDLAGYIVDTCDGRGRTELRMTSVNYGVIRRFASKSTRKGTTIDLLWKSEKPLDTIKKKLSTSQKIVRQYCRYLAMPVFIDNWDEESKRFCPQCITVKPEFDNWISCGTKRIEDTHTTFHYRFGHESGLVLYQGGVFVVEKTDLFDWQWEIHNLAIMVDSQAFKLPISRNDIIEDSVYRQICSFLINNILPEIIEKLCRQIGCVNVCHKEYLSEYAANIVIDYLQTNPYFAAAQNLPLIPVLPFGFATVNQIRSAYQQHESLLICKCSGDEFDGVTGRDIVIDEKRMTSRMEKFLERHFAPLKHVNYQDEAIEAPAHSNQAGLSALERRFQESLVLLCNSNEMERLELKEKSTHKNGAFKNTDGQWPFTGIGESDEYGPLQYPELPEICFKLTRLVRLDGKTPVESIKFKVNGSNVILNLNHPEIRNHLLFAEKDPDLAAHWCLRELILCDRIECFKHLNYDACEALVLHDAIGRCTEVEYEPLHRKPGKGSFGKSYWNDDFLDWNRLT
jgi:hypothetical protein